MIYARRRFVRLAPIAFGKAGASSMIAACFVQQITGVFPYFGRCSEVANATWKKHERRTAAALGGRRVGPTGKDGPDVDAGWLVAECKHRAQLPGWIDTALGKVRSQAGPARLGVVVAHERGARDSWVILSLHDFRDWFGDDPGAIWETSGNDPGSAADAGGGDLPGLDVDLAEIAPAADQELAQLLAEFARADAAGAGDLAGVLRAADQELAQLLAEIAPAAGDLREG